MHRVRDTEYAIEVLEEDGLWYRLNERDTIDEARELLDWHQREYGHNKEYRILIVQTVELVVE